MSVRAVDANKQKEVKEGEKGRRDGDRKKERSVMWDIICDQDKRLNFARFPSPTPELPPPPLHPSVSNYSRRH